jgi:hypothetical protein
MLDGIITFPTVSVFILMLNLRNGWFVCILYWVFRAQADWTFILPSEFPTKNAAPGLSEFTVRGAAQR